ncbi:Neurofilament heavy polypeptide [Collichthys lucidus]|uniref:Neurofilament heavy polypeptide n=1 Tax=Collichthys lucidus TaxID=240159 RepID=A0A4V6ARE8_COLLU|nr:Neurofilament heavy polypeptide [Collichthys lucidus]
MRRHSTAAPVKQKTKPVQHQKRTTAPGQEQAKPVQQQYKPVQQQQNTTAAVQQQTKSVQQQTKPVQQQTKPVQQQNKPVQEQAKTVQQQAKTVQQQTKPVQQQTKPVQQQAKPVQQQNKPVQEQAKTVQQQAKPVQEQTKTVQQQAKTMPEQTKPVQEQANSVQQQKKKTSPVLHVTVSQQRPTAAPQQTAQTVPPCDMATADSAYTSQVATYGLCRHGLHQVEHSDVVRGVPTENLPRGTTAQIKMLRQKTDKTHNTAEMKATEGRRHPFKVNQSCPHDIKRNTGKGLPPNVQQWCDEPPYHLCEPPWVTTTRLAAFLALTEAQMEGEDAPQ